MRKLLIAVALCAVLLGCSEEDWGKVEKVADDTAATSTMVGKGATATSPWTGPWGLAAGGVAAGIAGIARAIAALAKAKRLAKSAVAAAEDVENGGAAIVKAATANGVTPEILAAYEAAIKAGTIKPKG